MEAVDHSKIVPVDQEKQDLNENNKSTDYKELSTLYKDTINLLKSELSIQTQLCDKLENENQYLQDYVENLMSSGEVLSK
ncbi:Slo1p SCDLUD_001688 [Saccharomycodes ludwigii]|uniref:Slo1p n=1 Tax=Saccharomycodes ludwigii TaxID=36035 RepID=UPI001E8A5896|nr:hypothetical protein SCDLUD_001688 [Saccharomycodes ludwigii]KAH3901904.1 hypothetical protein SCDLUD_001688 [Saccharomycodes ludwigii]